jgi:hypothetical protein
MRSTLEFIGSASATLCAFLVAISLLSASATGDSALPNNTIDCNASCSCVEDPPGSGTLKCESSNNANCETKCHCVKSVNTGNYYCAITT